MEPLPSANQKDSNLVKERREQIQGKLQVCVAGSAAFAQTHADLFASA
jgi:hypothetical protein